MTIRSLFVCAVALSMLAGCGKSKEAYEKSFKESFQKSFVKSCVESATKGANGLKADLARTKCECTAKFMIDKYSSTDLTKLSVAPNSPETAKILEEAINSCK